MCISVVRAIHDPAFKLFIGSYFRADCKEKLALVDGRAGWLEGKHCSFSFEGLAKVNFAARINSQVNARD